MQNAFAQYDLSDTTEKGDEKHLHIFLKFILQLSDLNK